MKGENAQNTGVAPCGEEETGLPVYSEAGLDSVAARLSHGGHAGAKGDMPRLPFLIRRDGIWLYRGGVIKRKAMLCLFGSLLTRDAQGAYLLRSPFESGMIEVEDAPFVAVELTWTGVGRTQRLCFRTNMDETVTASCEHPIRTEWDVPPEASADARPPYLLVRAGDGRWPLEARLSRSVWYELAALAEPGVYRGVRCMGVWSCGSFFPLARCETATGQAGADAGCFGEPDDTE